MSVGFRLPFEFGAQILRAELDLIRSDEWSPHYNERDYGGIWRGVALRSRSGLTTDLIATPGNSHESFRDTDLLRRLPAFAAALARFHCPLKAVRLLSLAPGSFIREHSDNALQYEDGELRIHIPVQTNPDVEFYVCGERLLLEPGSCYYVNVNLPHRVNNRGGEERIHLVIDATVNEWVKRIFENEVQPVARCSAPPRNMLEFQSLALATEELQLELRNAASRPELVKRTVQVALRNGFELFESDVEAAFRADPPVTLNLPAGWTPINIRNGFAEAIQTGAQRFSEPFFEDTVRVALRSPTVALFRRRVPIPSGELPRSMDPAGFIFHMSRCGSTLVSRMFAALDRTTVISEAPPIDDVLQQDSHDQIDRLRWIFRALAQPRAGSETHAIFKLDAWHMHRFDAIRQAFPNTPWIFVSRNPAEILKSWYRVPGKQSIPGGVNPRALNLQMGAELLPREEWCNQVLAGFTAAKARLSSQHGGLMIDYAELPGAAITRIATHFGLNLTPAEITQMSEAGRYDAKNPTQLFGLDLNGR